MTRTFKCTGCKERYDSSIEVIKNGTSRFHSKQCRLDYARQKVRDAREKQANRQKKLKQQKQNSPSKLIKLADTLFSRYIRYRDSLKTT